MMNHTLFQANTGEIVRSLRANIGVAGEVGFGILAVAGGAAALFFLGLCVRNAYRQCTDDPRAVYIEATNGDYLMAAGL